MTDPKDIVRSGYDALSHLYRADDAPDAEYSPWLADLDESLPRGADILDIGCGNGVPVARGLTARGHRVTGVDLSPVQIARADATFIEADATEVAFGGSSFDAVVSFYAMIHMPHEDQYTLLSRVASWLRPGGWFVATVGHRAWTGTEDGWLGGSATMWWSHPDAATYRAWLIDAGLTIEHESFVPEGDGGHTLLRAQRRTS